MRIFELQKARYELKVVLLYLWRVDVKTIRGFINIPLADLSYINMRHNNITRNTNTVGRPRQNSNKIFGRYPFYFESQASLSAAFFALPILF